MTRVWKTTNNKGGMRLLLLAIADYCNDDGVCWPSYETLAKKCAHSRRYTIMMMNQLEEAGIITRDSRGHGTSNLITLDIDRLEVVNPSSLVIPRSPDSDPQITRVVIPRSPDPSLNRQEPLSQKKSRIITDTPGKKQQAMFGALLDFYRYDGALLSKQGKGRLAKLAKNLIEKDITPGDVSAAEAIWREYDWRGQKGQAPTKDDDLLTILGRMRQGYYGAKKEAVKGI